MPLIVTRITSRHPGMHKTRTIDYVVLLSGEVTLLLDKGEVDLKPFDVVVQCGTSHAWVNNGKEPALIAAVRIDAKAWHEKRPRRPNATAGLASKR
jgi:mannose-6-phosphate isomerase-like protein (cupin superfamily)